MLAETTQGSEALPACEQEEGKGHSSNSSIYFGFSLFQGPWSFLKV
jgi:hypothetical protein